MPLEVLAFASLAVHSYCNTLGLLVAIRITQPYIDIGRLFETVDATMRTSKIASAMEFTVVAAVSQCGPLGPFSCDRKTDD